MSVTCYLLLAICYSLSDTCYLKLATSCKNLIPFAPVVRLALVISEACLQSLRLLGLFLFTIPGGNGWVAVCTVHFTS